MSDWLGQLWLCIPYFKLSSTETYMLGDDGKRQKECKQASKWRIFVVFHFVVTD